MSDADGPLPIKAGRLPADRARLRAARNHQGPGHWHVEKTRDAIVCRACGARIAYWMNPTFCPECGDGKESA